jgi:5,6,7,8-tetrahydromethanopterin hydro-lyase
MKWCDENWQSFLTGEALNGEGSEVSHIDLLIGNKKGHAGAAFAHALATQTAGHTSLFGVLKPNLPVKPDTITITKVTMKNINQAVLMFGAAQSVVTLAIADELADGTFGSLAENVDDLCVVCGVFIHPVATDKEKILRHNYKSVRAAIRRAARHEPSPERVVAGSATALHPFALDGNPTQEYFAKILAEMRRDFPCHVVA